MTSDDSLLPYLREQLQRMPAWRAPPTAGALAAAGTDTAGLRLMGLNECPYPPSPRVIDAIRGAAADVNRYPDAACPELSAIMAERTGVPATRIVWGAGSEEVMMATVQCALGPGDRAVAPTPTFPRYGALFAALGADVTAVANRADGANDVRDLIAACGADTRLLICVTPNNPTGAMLSAEDLATLAAQTPDHVLLSIDEAYFEFARHAGGPDAAAAMARRDGPWIVSRTFSKAYAIAGLRIGYCLCASDAIAEAMRWSTGTFNVQHLAQVAALAALEDDEYARGLLDRNAAERGRTVDGLRRLGLDPLPSAANFVAIALPMRGDAAAKALMAKGILVSPLHDPGFDNHIRVTMGRADDTDAFLAALESVLAAAG